MSDALFQWTGCGDTSADAVIVNGDGKATHRITAEDVLRLLRENESYRTTLQAQDRASFFSY